MTRMFPEYELVYQRARFQEAGDVEHVALCDRARRGDVDAMEELGRVLDERWRRAKAARCGCPGRSA